MAKTTEEIIKALLLNQCRVCKHYIRVNFDGYRNVINRQGFCILGQLDGDYGLYISSSHSHECMAFVFSEQHYQITEAEHQLDKDCNNYLDSLRDKRTTAYKEIEPLLKSHQDFLERTEDKPKGLAWMDAEMQIRKVGCEHFRELNFERFKVVYDMVSLRKTDYLKFLAKVSVEIHNQFCGCDKVEFADNTDKKGNAVMDLLAKRARG